MMIFNDREDAGQQLAKHLSSYGADKDIVVLGIPRGGVPVAFEIANALHAPLDIFLSRKLGVPGHEELAFGALAAGDGRFLDTAIIEAAGISPEQIERITDVTRKTLKERALLYRMGRAALIVEGKIVILVDDGIATGSSIYAAVYALRQMKPKKLVVAVPVAPRSTVEWLRRETDEIVVVHAPVDFSAVGQFYHDFRQTSDQEVIDLLRRSAKLRDQETSDVPREQHLERTEHETRREVSIPVGEITLEGILTLPQAARGVVLFAHGSGSSRHSLRNRYVAAALHSRGLATLLFDLLTSEEEWIDRSNAALRFNIGLLADRLVAATQWIRHCKDTMTLPIGYFGASTGAAAALVAAARLPDTVGVVVSRGGRPDLAEEALGYVHAATLLIVGGADETVMTLNRRALNELHCQSKRLVVVPQATHLFEEPGALEQVARLAGDWLLLHISSEFDRMPILAD